MMKHLFFNLVLLTTLMVGLASCSGSDSDSGNSTNYEALAAKYDITGSTTYKSIELTKQGQYIITLNSSTASSKDVFAFVETGITRSSSNQTVYTGTYTALGNNTYNLTDFGTIKLNTSGDNSEVTSIEVTPTGGTPVTVSASRVAAIPASSATNKLCRTWDLKTIKQLQTTNGTTEVSTYNVETGVKTGSSWDGFEPWQIIFTPSGTLCSIYPNDPTLSAVMDWSWITEGDSIKFGGETVATSFKGDSLVMTFNETSGSTKLQYIETYYPATVNITPTQEQTSGSSVNGKTGLLAAMGISSPIKQITESSQKDTVSLSYTNGNLTSILWTQDNEGHSSDYYMKATFSYTPLIISTQSNDAGDISTAKTNITGITGAGYITSMSSTTSFNGQAIGMKSTITYSSDGHITTMEMNAGNYSSIKYTYTWSGGNIVKATVVNTGTYDGETEKESAVYSFSYGAEAARDNGLFYTQTISTLNEFESFCGNDNNPMFFGGLFGVKPVNIPTSYTLDYTLSTNGSVDESSTGTVNITPSTDSNGRIVKLKEYANYTHKGYSSSKTYENIISY